MTNDLKQRGDVIKIFIKYCCLIALLSAAICAEDSHATIAQKTEELRAIKTQWKTNTNFSNLPTKDHVLSLVRDTLSAFKFGKYQEIYDQRISDRIKSNYLHQILPHLPLDLFAQLNPGYSPEMELNLTRVAENMDGSGLHNQIIWDVLDVYRLNIESVKVATMYFAIGYWKGSNMAENISKLKTADDIMTIEPGTNGNIRVSFRPESNVETMYLVEKNGKFRFDH